MLAQKILIAGLGNPLLRDDAAGHYVIDILQDRFKANRLVCCKKLYCGGLDLISEFMGFTHVIIIDCLIQTGVEIGEIRRFRFSNTNSIGKINTSFAASHGIDLYDAISVAQALGLGAPVEIIAFGIGGGDVTTFDEVPQTRVRAAIVRLAVTIEKEVVNILSTHPEKEACYHE